ncbi:unnamed protein product [Paramecium primaurelia]|uniref:FACT complex subunit SSRP1-like first PH domain-containing protein n=1 Tax=Paramecium primaurelia TaxID=5886 RepID=A0A8S1LR16_PARPR|nr:unnamed protein product [Paramecium primaurelia]
MSQQFTKGINWGSAFNDDKYLTLKQIQINLIKLLLKKVINSTRFLFLIKNKKSNKKKKYPIKIQIKKNLIIQEKSQHFNRNYKMKLQIKQKLDKVLLTLYLQFMMFLQLCLGDIILWISLIRHSVSWKYLLLIIKESQVYFYCLCQINLSLVIRLEHPFRQGQTAYNYLVMLFKKDYETDIKLKYQRNIETII